MSTQLHKEPMTARCLAAAAAAAKETAACCKWCTAVEAAICFLDSGVAAGAVPDAPVTATGA
jgi:hypothetical protein